MISVIIVSHDSEAVLPRCLDALARSSVSDIRVIVADSGSADRAFLNTVAERDRPFALRLLFCGDVGFAAANNCAFQQLITAGDDTDPVLFLNPDAYVEPETVAEAIKVLAADSRIGALSGRLLGCAADGTPGGRIDSTGICRRWYGRWYDRGQGEIDVGQFADGDEPTALCGAFMFCRKEALRQLWRTSGFVFDPAFFLYKEDIELSLRLRRCGWRLWYAPTVRLLHCRGWAANRREMPLSRRLLAAENEVRLYLRHPSPYLLWAVGKYLLVRLFKV